MIDNPWVRYLSRRLGFFLVSLIALVTASFLLVQLIPGDPALASAGPLAPPEAVERRRVELGLDLPLWQQYGRFWTGLLSGDLGYSITSRTPVVDVLTVRAPATLALSLPAVAMVLVLAIPLGLYFGAITRGARRRFLELGFNSISGVLAVIPEFLLGVVLVYFFAVQSQLLPVAGQAGAASYVMPLVAMSLGPLAGMTRIVRAETLTVLQNDYVRTARAKRMAAGRLYLRHVLPNLVTATLTISGLLLASMIAGSVLVENIFAWPGLGMTIVESIKEKDFPMVQAIVIFYGAIVLLINLLIDVALIALDPRAAVKDR